MLVRQRYGNSENFLVTFNPSAQIIAARHEDRAFFGEAPTLVILKKTYGDNFPGSWLMAQILDLVAYSNSKGTLNEYQAEFLAEVIANDYYYLKASELLLFFYRFKAGRYGHFYGVVDPMRITEALEEFCKERARVLERKEQKESREDRATAPDTISPEEWCRQAGLPECHTALEAWQMRNRIQDIIEGVLWFINIMWNLVNAPSAYAQPR